MATARQTVSTLVLSSLLVMGACSKKENGGTDTSLHSPNGLRVTEVSKNQITNLMKVKARDVDDVNAQTALKALGLFESGSEGVSWEKRTGDKGNYVFTGVRAKSKNDSIMRIDTLTFQGVHMEGDYATFDRMDVSDLTIADPSINVEGEGGSKPNAVSVDIFSVANPEASIAPTFVKSVLSMQSIDDVRDTVEGSGEHLPIGGLWLENLKFVQEDGSASLANFGWAENHDTGTALFKLDNLKVNTESKGKPVNLSLKSIAATGLDVAYLRKVQSMVEREGRLSPRGINFSGANPFKQNFEDVAIKEFKMGMEGLELKTDEVTANSRFESGVTTIYQNMKPFIVSFPTEPTDPDIKRGYDNLKKLGYDKLEFTISQISQLDENKDTAGVTSANFVMKDGFDIKYSYAAQGLKMFTQKMDMAGEDEAKINEALSEMKLTGADIVVTDKSLLDRVFKMTAAERGTSEDVLRMQAKGMTAMLAMGAKNEAEAKVYGQLSEALGSFIESGGSLHIAIKPTKPIPMSSLGQNMASQVNLDDFGLTVEHKAK